jgi:hypothetical protein
MYASNGLYIEKEFEDGLVFYYVVNSFRDILLSTTSYSTAEDYINAA